MSNRINYKKLKPGDIVSEVQHYIYEGGSNFKMDNGKIINIGSGYADSAEMFSADQYTTETKVTKTQLAEIILENRNKAMTISYNKILKEKEELKRLAEIVKSFYPNKGTILSQKDYEAKVEKSITKDFTLQGEERIIRGRHYGQFDDTNTYLKFIDMDVKKDSSSSYDTRQRMVNLRDPNWVIVNNIKYIKK